MGLWGVSIRNAKVRRMIICDSLEQAKKIGRAALKKFADRKDVTVEIISRTKAFAPPEGFKHTRSVWWCPYCKKIRRFYHDEYVDARRCPVCGISDREYYVRKYNGLMRNASSIGPTAATKRRQRREEKKKSYAFKS